MAKSNPKILLDTDVLVSWLTKERETVSNKNLWEAPFKIVELAQDGKLNLSISLLTLLEIRFVLRRKKGLSNDLIEGYIDQMLGVFKVLIPDEVTLLRSNKLQSEQLLDPFDSILLALGQTMEEVTLISRDKAFLKIAKNYLLVNNPEMLVGSLKL